MSKGTSPGFLPGFQARAVVQGIVASVIILLVLSALLTFITYFWPFQQSYFGLAAGIVGLLGAAGGGAYASRRASNLGLVHGIAVGLGLVLLSLAVGHWIWHEPVALSVEARRLVLATLVGGIGGIIGLNL